VFRTGRVEVIVPRRASAVTVQRFIEQHRAWIERKRTQALHEAVPEQPFPPARVELTACAESWRVHLAGGRGRPRLRVLAPGVLGIAGDAGNVHLTRAALRRWLMLRASQVLAAALAGTANEIGLRYTRAVIRRQRSRWGSCSSRGTVSLNCSLLFQRPEVVRYLLVHELAHTLHMNHSKRFWVCVARHCPDYERLDRELLEGWRRVPAWMFDRPS
jgi:predicted metal-dependent hydrolase